MSRLKGFGTIALLALLGSALAAPALAQDGTSGRRQRGGGGGDGGGDAFTQAYAVLLETNIFVKDRRPRRTEDSGPTTRPDAPPPPRPETAWVLSGIVYEDGAFRAYFENVRDGGVTRAAPGEAIAAGRVAQVYIDAVAYQGETGEPTWVEVGQDLTGTASVALASQQPVPPASSATPAASGGNAARPGGAPATGTDGRALSIEERLRQRRMQESGGARPQPSAAPGGPPSGPPPSAEAEAVARDAADREAARRSQEAQRQGDPSRQADPPPDNTSGGGDGRRSP